MLWSVRVCFFVNLVTDGVAQLIAVDPKWVFTSCAIISAIGVLTTIFLTEETVDKPLSFYELEEEGEHTPFGVRSKKNSAFIN